jgi:glutamyl/glutaminyl-tRNA synthetase
VSAPAVGRYAPSATGLAHPGTLLAGLLAWLDARSRGGRIALRIEDLDPDRCRPEWARAMRGDLGWLGLDFDEVSVQSAGRERHEHALERLAGQGALYPCSCSRADLRVAGVRGLGGTFRYPGTCRGRALPAGGWRATDEPLRARLPAGRIELFDESGLDLSNDPVEAFGDPVVRRRDGAIAYHLASVADDAALGVTRVVRGRDLAPSTSIQVALQRLLGLSTPAYRHHALLLDERGGKLSKMHGSIAAARLRTVYDAPGLCGVLAGAVGLCNGADPVSPNDLVASFDWARVGRDDVIVRETPEGRLEVGSTR